MADNDQKSPFDVAGLLTDRVEDFVQTAHERLTRPIVGLIRFLVIGAVASLVGLAVLVLLVVGVTYLFDHDVFGGRVWATYFLFGGIFIAAGALVLAKSGFRRAN
jgi:hypothetical protein